MSKIMERSLNIHGNELTHRGPQRLHPIHFAIILKHSILGASAIHFIPKCKVVFCILVYTKNYFPDRYSLFIKFLNISFI